MPKRTQPLQRSPQLITGQIVEKDETTSLMPVLRTKVDYLQSLASSVDTARQLWKRHLPVWYFNRTLWAQCPELCAGMPCRLSCPSAAEVTPHIQRSSLHVQISTVGITKVPGHTTRSSSARSDLYYSMTSAVLSDAIWLCRAVPVLHNQNLLKTGRADVRDKR